MEKPFERSELLLGVGSTDVLSSKKVAVIGVGGVGGYVVEALARSGVGRFLLVDGDRVAVSNLNRQIIALNSTVGRFKTDVFKERILDINPSAEVTALNLFYLPEKADELDLSDCDYVVDCIDTVTAKLDIAKRCFALNIPEISAMGAGNKLDPTRFEIADLYSTSVCPLAKVMRRELKKAGITKLKVAYSKEEPKVTGESTFENGRRIRPTTGSLPFVPSVMGLLIAREVVLDLLEIK